MTFTNPIPAPLIPNQEFAMGNFTSQHTQTIRLTMHRHHKSIEFFAANCRLWVGDSVLEQAAFSDAQLGNTDSSGDCTFTANVTAGKSYDVTYSVDARDPQGTHEVGVLVTGKSK